MSKMSVLTAGLVPHEAIVSKIYVLRGRKVLLDRDLAVLYGVETRALNQAVRRNLDRFPEDFMFSLTRAEIRNISQFVISLKHAPSVFAFSEQGVAMLSSVLNSKQAIHVNIEIIRTFTKLREYLVSHKDLQKRLDAMEKRYDQQFTNVFEVIRELEAPVKTKRNRKIGFHAT